MQIFFKSRVDNLAEQITLTLQEASHHEDNGDYEEALKYLLSSLKSGAGEVLHVINNTKRDTAR